MFLGHFAIAFAAKRVDPRPSLGWTFAACQLPDLLWPVFCLVGMEHFRIAPGDTAFTPLAFDYYPWSHSLLMDVLWGAALGLLYLWRSGDRAGAVLIATIVVSHWVLDCITHGPDLPLSPGELRHVGLGLWRSVPLTILAELLMFLPAAVLYHRGTSPRDRIGRIGFLALAGFLVVTYFANIFAPPPPSTTVVSLAALALWALVPLTAWIDRHRAPRP